MWNLPWLVIETRLSERLDLRPLPVAQLHEEVIDLTLLGIGMA